MVQHVNTYIDFYFYFFKYSRFLFDILLKEELSSCDGNRPVCRVDQVIDTLTVLGGQHLLCTTVETTTKSWSIKTLYLLHAILKRF